MAEIGIYSTDLPLVAALDEVVGNVAIDGVQRSARQSMADHAQQIAGAGPIAEALAEEAAARENADAALDARLDTLDAANLPTRMGVAEASIDGHETRIDNVESLIAIGAKTPVAVKTIAAASVVIASGLVNGATIGGVVVATGDIVLLPVQAAPAENGPYTVVAAGAASRTPGFTTSDQLRGSTFSAAGSVWAVRNTSAINVGVDAITISKSYDLPGGTEIVDARQGEANLAANLTAMKVSTSAAASAAFNRLNFGRAAPAAGAVVTSATLQIYKQPRPRKGRIVGAVIACGTSAGPIDLVHATDTGADINVVEKGTITLAANSTQTVYLATPIEYPAGACLGFDIPATNRMQRTTAPEANGGRWQGTAGASTMPKSTLVTTSTLQANLIIEEAGAVQVLDELEQLRDLTLSETAFGSNPVVGTSEVNAVTTFYAEPMARSRTVTSVDVYGGASGGILEILAGYDDGSNIVQEAVEYVIVAAGGLQNIPLARPLSVGAGKYVGVRVTSANVFRYSTATAEANGGRWQAASTVTTVPKTGLVSTSRLQVRLNMDEDATGGAVAEANVAARLFGAPLLPMRFLFDGNSHFAGVVGNVPSPTQIASFLGTTVLNYGAGGQTTQQMSADAATQIDPVVASYIADGYQPVLFVQEIYNDKRVNALTQQQAVDNMLAYCQARRAANPSLFIVLLNLADTQTSGSFLQSDVVPINTLLAAQAVASGYIDALADIRAASQLQDYTNATYYIDGTHRTTAGEAIVARLSRLALRSLLESR
ncbi:SGNH/GDSL hydrolase family protein [Mesorhizobium sp. M6A.T.Ca.TU.002.02.2.1]|nr:SGNH/GDSL hydrolase family protein [Mesorhizobium sp. M6A.T.Ca.TU.002.02.2.1]